MIVDHIDRFSRYPAIPHHSEILAFLAAHEVQALADGEYPVLGRTVTARVFSYRTRPADELDFEIHRNHLDVQVILAGTEFMMTARPNQLAITNTPAIPMSGDWIFYTATGCTSAFVVAQGHFAVFYPGEAHKPNCMIQAPEPVKKLIFKVEMACPWLSAS